MKSTPNTSIILQLAGFATLLWFAYISAFAPEILINIITLGGLAQ